MQKIFSEHQEALNRGWQLGDGHFTTLHARRGRLRLWPYHQARLAEACRRLLMAPPDWDALYRQATAAAEDRETVVRVTLLRGPGARGYGIAGCADPTLVINTAPFPQAYLDWRDTGVEIGVCAGRLGHSPLLAGLKTVNRLEQVLLKAELERAGLAEGVVLDQDGHVLEAVTANLFWRRGEHIYTPVLDRGGVRGTLRGWLLDRLGHRVRQVRAPLQELLAADEAWLCNALMGIVPVAAIAGHSLPSSFSTARGLQQQYEQID
ncbi:aminodeoxychorismate lyase [Zobellella taiwanensis]